MKCPHCGEKAAMPTFGLRIEPYDIAISRGVKVEALAAAHCPACGQPVCARLGSQSFPKEYNREEQNFEAFATSADASTAFGFKVIDVWPKPPPPDIPRHLPIGIESRLLDAERCFVEKIFAPAVAFYRTVVDLTTKDQTGGTDINPKISLQQRLDRLCENHIIPQTIADWGHEVRVVGNDAVHDDEKISKEDAAAVRDFALTYLRYAYELPGDIAERRAQAAKAVTAPKGA
jgi:hypothetical protein